LRQVAGHRRDLLLTHPAVTQTVDECMRLLLRRLGPGGPRVVTVAMFGLAGLGMFICR